MPGSLAKRDLVCGTDNRHPARVDFARAAETIAEVAELVVERVGVEPGMEVLDVACGTGNATIPAAREGARVTGLDPSADLLAIARERAADAMVEIDWVEGDPRELPFEDGAFDRVISVLGTQDDRVAGEMRRTCRGRIAICSWAPDGAMGRMLGVDAEPSFEVSERHEVELHEDSVGRFADFMLESVGSGSADLRDRFIRCLEDANEADDGSLRFRAECLIAVVDV
jgi:SAM-dependent methyltransferase